MVMKSDRLHLPHQVENQEIGCRLLSSSLMSFWSRKQLQTYKYEPEKLPALAEWSRTLHNASKDGSAHKQGYKEVN
ncbi:hypothetical protein AVEN_222704-1 [Araneus ventricosus]|uniref:Uncharacterized protein n=1 Tax=Araneus ventricosus TaxID=182803 RepID=A0A4Y2AYQ0_ARAVE|nr:hypothetical protein AVEN_222704-1 [Araneus ventricosus]